MNKSLSAKFEYLGEKYKQVAAFQYCSLVLNGEYVASKKVIASCRRFINELYDSETNDKYKYHFVINEAQIMEQFYLSMRPNNSKNSRISRGLFQLFIFQQFAWEHKNKPSVRRFKHYYISMGRKQGKTFLIAMIVLYDLLAAKIPEQGKEIILTASVEKQAEIIFRMCVRLLKGIYKDKMRGMGGYLIDDTTVKVYRNKIEDTKTDSWVKYYANEPDTIDGTHPLLGVIDEYANFSNIEGKRMLSVLSSGSLTSSFGATVRFSTVSDNLNSYMFHEYKMIENMVSTGSYIDDFFFFVAELDEEDEYLDIKKWAKAMPMLLEDLTNTNEVAYDNIKQEVEKVQKGGTDKNAVLTKTFNVWPRSREDSYIDYKMWEANALEEYDKKNKDVSIGLDLSERRDATGLSFIFEDKNYLYVDTHAFVAGMASTEGKEHITLKSKQDEFDYVEASKKGDVTISEETIDYGEVWKFIGDYIKKYDLRVRGLYIDPHNMVSFLSKRPKELTYIQIVEVRQGYQELTAPLKEFVSILYEGKVKHSNNEFLNYNVKNAQVKKGGRNGMLIEKPSMNLRIDSLAATIDAYYGLVDYDFDAGVSKVGLSLSERIEASRKAGVSFY